MGDFNTIGDKKRQWPHLYEASEDMRLLQDNRKKVVRAWGVKIVQCQVLEVIFLPDLKKFLFLTLNFVK